MGYVTHLPQHICLCVRACTRTEESQAGSLLLVTHRLGEQADAWIMRWVGDKWTCGEGSSIAPVLCTGQGPGSPQRPLEPGPGWGQCSEPRSDVQVCVLAGSMKAVPAASSASFS